MAVSAETVAGLMTGAGVAGTALGAFVKGIVKNRSNGNHLISEKEHNQKCEANLAPIIERLNSGDKAFDEIKDTIKGNHSETMRYLMDLAGKK